MTIVKGGNRYFFCTPPYILDTIDPYAGVKSADLASSNGTCRNSVNLSNFQGMSLVPPEATTIRAWCHLFRAVASPVTSTDTGGNLDITMSLSLPTVNGEVPKNFATGAVTTQSAGQPFPPGTLVESLGEEIEFPNIAETNGNYGRFTWSMGGNTILGAAAMLRVTSFEVPPGYTLPALWPAKNVVHSSIAMYFGPDGFLDSSPAARTVTTHNSSVQPDGGANFNGLNTHLSFDGHDITLSSDFTIEVTMKGSTNALQGGSQQRILSLGGVGSPAIGIDQIGGGAILLNELVGIIKTGGNSLISGFPTNIKWTRESGVNTLIVNGQRDGQPFTDTTAWVLSSSAEVGRLNGHSTMGYFTGEVYFVSIVNGQAV
jgi:hypothetical protein